MAIKSLFFEKVSPTLTLAVGVDRFYDGEKNRKREIVVGMISDMSHADNMVDYYSPSEPLNSDIQERRYLVLIYNHPRLDIMRDLPHTFQCRSAFSYKSSRNQAADFIKEYFGVPTNRRGDD